MRITGVVSALLAALCLLLPSFALGEETTFIVHLVKAPGTKLGATATVWTADCPKINLKLAKQNVSCTLEQNICTDKCPFTQKSTDTPPVAAVFSWSTYNPTCAYVWDPWSQRYVFRCW